MKNGLRVNHESGNGDMLRCTFQITVTSSEIGFVRERLGKGNLV